MRARDWRCYIPSDREISVANARWRFPSRPENALVAARLEDWGAQAQFLYAAGWAVLLASVLPIVLPACLIPDRWWRLIIAAAIGLVLLVAAWVHDRRMMLHERRFIGG
jgi:hypothetical protein